MKTRNLNEDEKLSTIEKLMLLQGEIAFQATAFMGIINTYKILVKTDVGEELKPSLGEHENALLKLVDDIYRAREEFMDYLNAHDAATMNIDTRLGELVYNAMNDIETVD